MNETQRLRVELAQAKKYLDITDVSLMSNKSISTIRRKISDGLIKAYQDVPNGKLLFKRIDVENWIEGVVEQEMNNREKIHAKRINHVFKSAKTLDKIKRDKFIKLGLKLAYLDDKLENFFSDVKKRRKE